jgi:hypothetical protein
VRETDRQRKTETEREIWKHVYFDEQIRRREKETDRQTKRKRYIETCILMNR